MVYLVAVFFSEEFLKFSYIYIYFQPVSVYHQNFATSPSSQARLPSTRIMWDFELPKLPSLTSRNLTTAILPPCMRVVFVMSHLRFRYHKNIIVYLR